ncbi:B12-binding domain-containing radical SAM protein [Candidatus Woesearchaeota archaeon]|nr:B12-binding domain-containing radical SAM protein [Candidatus Woesearchaeota archaeon]
MVKKKILLIQPRLSLIGKWCRVPLNLLALASSLDKGEYDIKIIDCMLEQDYLDLIEKECQSSLCMGITALTGFQIKDGLLISQKIKEKYPSIPIIWGGWHASIMPQQTIRSPYIDIVVKGQGENTFKELVHCLEKKFDLKGVEGILFKKNDKIIETENRKIEDVNSLLQIDYSLIDLSNYFTQELNTHTINFISSRGCPNNCGFCADALVYRRMWRGLKAERVILEIKKLKKRYGVNGIIFEDNNFFVDKVRVKKICRGFIKNKFNIKWHADGRASQLVNYGPELVSLLKKSGCSRILIGAESGSDELLKKINKGEKSATWLQFAEWGKQNNIRGRFSFIWGLPGETQLERKKTIKVIENIKKIDPRHGILAFFYTPYPGTPLFALNPNYGKVAKTLEEWGNCDLNNLNINCITEREKGRLENFVNFYLENAYPSVIPNNKNKFLGILNLGLRLISKLRIRLNFFSFPAEKWLVSSYVKLSSNMPSKKSC